MLEHQFIPLDLIGLDPRPQRRIRPLDPEHIRNLVETSQPDAWDPIEIRAWPETDPYPDGEEGRTYQVISGYHRTTAARILGLETIRATIITEPLDDLAFQLRAFHTNARHGKPMSPEEKQALARRLRILGMSEGDIAREMGTPRATVHNWLSGRNTNAARSVRTHKASGDNEPDEIDPWLRSAPATLDAKAAARVSSVLSDFLAGTPTQLTPEEVIGWVRSQTPPVRRSLAEDVDDTIRWLGHLRAVLIDMASSTPDREGVA
jgi:ParB-like nuclease domain